MMSGQAILQDISNKILQNKIHIAVHEKNLFIFPLNNIINKHKNTPDWTRNGTLGEE